MNRRARQAGLVRERTPKKPAAVRRHPRPWNRIDDEEMVLYLCDSVRKLLKKPVKNKTLTVHMHHDKLGAWKI